MYEARKIFAGSEQIGCVQLFLHASSGTRGCCGSQPETVLPSSQVSLSSVCSTPSPQDVQSGRQVTCPVVWLMVVSGGSQVSPGSMTPLPHRTQLHSGSDGHGCPGMSQQFSCTQRKPPAWLSHRSTVHGSVSAQLRGSLTQELFTPAR